MTSSDGYSTFEWQTGQRSGRLNLRSFPVRRSRTGPSTCGITSPARVTSTQSPANVLRFDQVEVVERGGGDRDTPDFHGLEHGIRVECAGASDVDPDLPELGDLDLGRELAGDGPMRLAIPHRAQLDVQLER